MVIDALFLVAMVIAVLKGLQRGFIIAIFSILGWIIGLAAAMKLSAVAAGYISVSVSVGARWLPVISFIIVFILVMAFVRLGAALLQKMIELTMMGWANRIGGVVIYALLYTFIFSIILFFAEQIRLLNAETIEDSYVYAFIKPLGPLVIDGLGKLIPFFKDSFTRLQEFFGGLSEVFPKGTGNR